MPSLTSSLPSLDLSTVFPGPFTGGGGGFGFNQFYAAASERSLLHQVIPPAYCSKGSERRKRQ